MGKNLKLLLLIVIVGIMTFICVADCKKHKDKTKHQRLLEHRHHHHHHHSRHHKHASSTLDEQRSEIKRKDHHKDGSKQLNVKSLREEMRKFHEKINKMLPRCKNGKGCPTGTCCWKGKCKILPHRLNQRCSTTCPCNDAKKSMYCHVKKVGSKTSKYGRCYIKGEEFGMKRVNFIPETIEKLKNVEKKMMMGEVVEEKKKMKKGSRGSRKGKAKGKKSGKRHSKKN